MNSNGKNIANAFSVVRKTYASIAKLHEHIIINTSKNSGYALAVDHFIRWISDKNYQGWLNNSFVFIFQRKTDIELENHWRDGAVYVFEINLWDEIEPKAYFARFDYAKIVNWSEGCSTAHHWAFWGPMHEDIGKREEINGITQITIDNEATSKKYWGVKKVKYNEIPLVEITSENFDDILKREFDKL